MSSRRARDRKKQQERSRRNRNLIFGIATVAIVVALGYFAWQQTVGGDAIPAGEVADPALGRESAIVEIVEYGDFGCSACRAWHNTGIREQVMRVYGDSARFVWRDFPVITPDSPAAAEAAQCAGAQDQFWAYHDHVYESGGSLNNLSLKGYAEQIGLDMEAFNACLDGGQMTAKVRDNEQKARALGLRGTPSFTVDGEVLPGPPTFEYLATLIEGSQ